MLNLECDTVYDKKCDSDYNTGSDTKCALQCDIL